MKSFPEITNLIEPKLYDCYVDVPLHKNRDCYEDVPLHIKCGLKI